MCSKRWLCVLAGLAFAANSQAAIVYDNLATSLGVFLDATVSTEIADDVALGPGPRVFKSAEIAYVGSDFDGDETITLKLYKMDGAPTAGSFGFNTPGTLLFSQTVPIAASNGTTVLFSDASGTVILPENVGLGLVFGGLDFDPTTGTGAIAGPLLYDPPVVGSSFSDYWRLGYPNPSDDWALLSSGELSYNFGARLTTASIPEPGTLALLGLGLAGLAAARRRKQ